MQPASAPAPQVPAGLHSVNRADSKANIAHPSPKPHSIAPVMAASSSGTNGAATKNSAAMSPVDNDPNTTQPIRPRGCGAEGDGAPDPSSGVAAGTGIGVVATMVRFAALAS